MEIDLTLASARECYRLLAGLVVPRPVAWVTTQDADGTVNLAPFSFFQVMSTAQRRVGLGIEARSGDTGNADDTGNTGDAGNPGEAGNAGKDTLRLARARGEFVVNLPAVTDAGLVDATSAELPPGTSEAEHAGVALVPGRRVSVPRVRDVPAALECRVDRVLALGGGDSWLVGEVVHVAVDDAVLDERHHVDYSRHRPLGRMVGQLYVDTDHVFTVDRPGRRTGVTAC